MLFKLWRLIQLLLPFGLIALMYGHRKSLPSNINLKNGRKLKAIMITTNYGILVSSEKYVKNRLQKLKQEQEKIFNYNNSLIKQINELTFEQREEMYNRKEHDTI